MGLLGNNENDSNEEVKISASVEQEEAEEADLMNEVESKFGNQKGSQKTGSSSSVSDNSVNLEDLHRQNEEIISLLRELTQDDEKDDNLTGGEMNGIL